MAGHGFPRFDGNGWARLGVVENFRATATLFLAAFSPHHQRYGSATALHHSRHAADGMVTSSQRVADSDRDDVPVPACVQSIVTSLDAASKPYH